eukprot:3069613-Ditylum_brightwellii.AAC.1
MLPDWIPFSSEKGQTEGMKNDIIIECLLKKKNISGCRGPHYGTLPEDSVAAKVDRGHPNLTASTAATGFVVYAVVPITEEEVVDLNANAVAVEAATHTTVNIIKATKLKPVTLLDSTAWLNSIKAYVNYVFAFFGALCPHYTQTKEVVNKLHGLKPETHKAISPESKAAILWIILLQGRHYAQGNIDVLAEFSTIQAALVTKTHTYAMLNFHRPWYMWHSNKREKKKRT